jgi:2-dehydro-3-deoxyphosphogluconate aldolase/(4S)-4-hydroxy-2-oxoglutarate aldolase
MSFTRQHLLDSRLVAIIRLANLERSLELVRTLLDAGVRCIEFTLTNPETPLWITKLLKEEPRFQQGRACLGMGSVRTLGEAEIALQSGSQFVVTPIASTSIVHLCKSRNVPIAAGALTPTEMAAMWDAGADLIKVFPARTFGPGYLRDVLAPMPYLKLMPTGGIDASNAQDYFQAGAVAVGIGGSLCRADWVESGQWELLHQVASLVVHAVAT